MGFVPNRAPSYGAFFASLILVTFEEDCTALGHLLGAMPVSCRNCLLKLDFVLKPHCGIASVTLMPASIFSPTSGDSSPRRSFDLGARANDLSAALDMLLADPAFSPFIDEKRIGVVGSSLGGAAALGLAGVRFDGSVQDANCTTRPDAADCAFFQMGDMRFADYPGYSADARDPPGLGRWW